MSNKQKDEFLISIAKMGGRTRWWMLAILAIILLFFGIDDWLFFALGLFIGLLAIGRYAVKYQEKK